MSGPSACCAKPGSMRAEAAPAKTSPPVTEDRILGGRILLRQPASGYRVGIDPVFLAAAAPSPAEGRVLELGCGVGAASLCLAWRQPNLQLSGLEIQPDLARLAARECRGQRSERAPANSRSRSAAPARRRGVGRLRYRARQSALSCRGPRERAEGAGPCPRPCGGRGRSCGLDSMRPRFRCKRKHAGDDPQARAPGRNSRKPGRPRRQRCSLSALGRRGQARPAHSAAGAERAVLRRSSCIRVWCCTKPMAATAQPLKRCCATAPRWISKSASLPASSSRLQGECATSRVRHSRGPR